MNRLSTTLKALTFAFFVMALSSVANAQATRTWVSGVGDDVNPCSRTAPCKTYAGAISKTAKDGEISTLDPGGFGAVTITKSITINGGGGGQGYGSILAALTNGVIINITDVNDIRKTVRLNWLDINGASSGLDGVRFVAGLALHVENTNIDGFTGDGIDVAISNVQTAAAEVYLRNVSIRNCVGNGMAITHGNASGVVVAEATNFHVGNCGSGVNMAIRSRLTVRDGTFHANTTGVNQTSTNAETSLFNCSLTNNVTAITAGAAPGIVRLSHTMIYGNGTSLTGNVKSWGNNFIDGNTTNNVPVLPNLPLL